MGNRFKKATAVILCFVLLFGYSATGGEGLAGALDSLFDALSVKASAETGGTCGDNLTWTLSDAGVLTVSGEGDMTDFSYSSTSAWRSDKTAVKSAVINPGVTSIGSYAFYGCTSLKSLTVSDSVKSIGSYAAANCKSLTAVNIGSGVTVLGNHIFDGCDSLEYLSVSADNSVYHSSGNCITETAGKTLIAGCKSSVIPSDGSITAIGREAFKNCKGLVSVTVPDSVTNIGSSAFEGCINLENLTLGSGVKTIGNEAFALCEKLAAVALPESVESIGSRAFEGSALSNISIPKNVAGVGVSPFSGCKKLERIDASAENTAYHSSGNCLIETDTGILISGCGGSVIPSDGSVTKIGDEAFSGCSGLTAVTIPDSVTDIGALAFDSCVNLESVSVGDGVSSLSFSAFGGCEKIKSLSIGRGVTSITVGKFSDSNVIESIAVSPENSAYSSNVNCIVEKGTKKLILGCKNTVIPDDGSVTSIGDSSFRGCSGLTAVTIPDSVTNIGASAFENCGGLKSISIPEGVTSIGDSAFRYCSGLETITVASGNPVYSGSGNCLIDKGSKTLIQGCAASVIPSDGSVTAIGESAFQGCEITDVTIPDGVTEIGERAFMASKIKSAVIPDSVTDIGERAFYSCYDLESAEIGAGVTNIGKYAFFNSENLSDIYYNGVRSQWDAVSVGENNTGLSDATKHFSDGEILQGAFYTLKYVLYEGNTLESRVRAGKSLSKPAVPEREGYTFDKWDKETPETMPAQDFTVSASWKINKYTLTFRYGSVNNNSVYKSVTQDYGTPVSLSDPTAQGYTFSGWDRAKPETMPAQNLTFTALWNVNNYKITYKFDGNEYAVDYIDYGETVTVRDKPEKENCDVTPWKFTPALINGKMPAGDVEASATSSLKKYTVTLSYGDAMGNAAYMTITQDYGSEIVMPDNPTVDGYTFQGWDTAIPATMPAENIEIKALWSVNQYTIKYFLDGKEYDTETYNYGDTVAVRDKPVKEGYNVTAWNFEPPLDGGKMPASDVKATAESDKVFDFEEDRWNTNNIYESIDIKYYNIIYGYGRGKKLANDSQGHCFGLAMSTAIFRKNQSLLGRFNETVLYNVAINNPDIADSKGKIFTPGEEEISSKEFVKYCHVYQNSPQFIMNTVAIETIKGKFPKDTVKTFYEAIYDYQYNEGSPVIMAFRPRGSGKAGHEVFVTGLVTGSYGEGGFTVGINDSEYYDNPNLAVKFTRRSDDIWEWKYGKLEGNEIVDLKDDKGDVINEKPINISGNTEQKDPHGTDKYWTVNYHIVEDDFTNLNNMYLRRLEKEWTIVAVIAAVLTKNIPAWEIPEYEGEGDDADAPALYWVKNLTNLQFENTVGKKAEFSVTGNDYAVESSLEPNASASLTVDNDNLKSQLEFSDSNEISVSYSYFNEDGKDKEVIISGSSEAGNPTLNSMDDKDNTILTGFDTCAVEVIQGGEVISSDSLDVKDYPEEIKNLIVTVDKDNVAEIKVGITVSINGFKPSSEINYRTTVTYHSSNNYLPSGASVHWFLNGEDCGAGEILTVREPRETYTVQVKVLDAQGKVLSESEVETVRVKNGFFARLIWFFRHLFNPASNTINR